MNTMLQSQALILAEMPGIAEAPAWFLAPIGAVCALIAALLFYKSVMGHTEGDPEMIRIAKAVRDGAGAYLGRQNRIVTGVFVALLVLLGLMAAGGLQDFWTVGGVAVAGLLSGICGFFGMKTATNASARTTAAAKESLNQGLTVAFRAGAVMGLCVTGFALLDISLWFFIFYVVLGDSFAGGLVDITTVTLSFAMGASLQALFARVGGGIFTKAADVGADLVGKVEAGIPEDDARNPATIADNVGDNVGDVAGMGADLYESYYGSVLAAMALAAAAAVQLSLGDVDGLRLVTIPPALAGLGILASILAIFVVRTKEDASLAQLLKSLHGGVWASSGLIVLGSAGLLWFALGSPEMVEAGVVWWRLWIAIVVGLISGLVIAWGTERYTSYEHAPTQRIAEQAQMGPATVIISGIAEGMRSTWIPLITVVIAILVSFVAAGGGDTFLLGVLGVGIAAVGMLSTLGITLATDAYGPIADNAGGNAEMTHQEAYVRERTDMLDSLGNTTAATGKGFAIGSAALTALALLAAYVITVKTQLGVVNSTPEDVQAATFVYEGHGVFAMDGNPGGDAPDPIGALLLASRDRSDIYNGFNTGGWDMANAKPMGDATFFSMESDGKTYFFEIVSTKTATIPQLLQYYNVTLMNPKVLAGLFLGVMLVFVFCAMTMNAVGRAAFAMIDECRRQFAIMKTGFKKNGLSDEDIADPLKWPYQIEVDGKEYPDYASCVGISTASAQKEMVIPSLMAVAVPIVVGLILGVAGVMGLLAGTLVCGFAVAIFMANAGGAWDNAKKYIETGKFGGKGSDSHKAGVVGDTVGDPFKDTSGPALNILIKLVSVVSVVFAALIVKVGPNISDLLGL
ncbi:MAG: V-type H(+)-translocating pyrophosphatase [Phycisphaerales bacterium]|nr:V-type H(+)-translocating pyrophosphatase [Phycisphaerales bacterium]MDG2134285.1 V-type H(+)-translocating pyrophosphatase [Phycisphaerales bacterium]